MKDWHFVTIRDGDHIEVRLYEGGDGPSHERLTFIHRLTDPEMHDLHIKLADALWHRTRKLP